MPRRDTVSLITGATSGIGRATVERLAPMGGTLVLVGRDRERTDDLVAELRDRNPDVHGLLADLSRVAEVRRLARTFRERWDRLDLLLNNAGAYFQTREETSERIERTLALNHLAYFVLTHELLDLLEASAPSRIVNVASDAHKGAHMHWGDLGLSTSYGGMGFEAYGQSKLANILFTRELARRLQGTDVTVNCLHPGFVASSFARNNGFFGSAMMTLTRPFQRSTAKAAEGVVHVCVSPEVAGVSGHYFVDGHLTQPAAAARSDEDAARLWAETEAMVDALS